MSDVKRPFTVGFCGRSGSGKSYVAKMFSKIIGGIWIDADEVYHKLLLPSGGEPSECCKAIAKALGSEFVGSDGTLDRKKLGKTVFSDKEKLEELNRISHTFIRDEIERIIKSSDCSFAAVDAVLLPFSSCAVLCDFMVAVAANEEASLERIMKRDSVSEKAAKARLNAQPPLEKYTEVCDKVIFNGIEECNLESQLDELINEVKKLASD